MLRPWYFYSFSIKPWMTTYSTSKLWSPRQILCQQRSFQLHWLALSFSLVLSRFLQIRLSSTTMTTKSNQKPELVSYGCKGENKASTQRGMLRQILFKKSTNRTLILSCFTALNLHPMKFVCRNPWRLSLPRQSSCLKYTCPNMLYWTQERYPICNSAVHLPSPVSFSKSCS